MAAVEKACGECGLCCKILEIEELEKPEGVWCKHARPGQGCAIYGSHPATCQAFRCYWHLLPEMADAWRPDRCGFLMREMPNRLLLVDVEPGRRDAWRRQPYYAQFKRWAAAALAGKGLVMVRCAGRATVVFPEADVDVGPVPAKQDVVTTGYELRDGARRPVVSITRADGVVSRYRG